VLWSTGGECLCGGKDSPHAFRSSEPKARLGELDQTLFAPLIEANVHGFGNSIRKEHQ
jgi:hypothetical protein